MQARAEELGSWGAGELGSWGAGERGTVGVWGAEERGTGGAREELTPFETAALARRCLQ